MSTLAAFTVLVQPAYCAVAAMSHRVGRARARTRAGLLAVGVLCVVCPTASALVERSGPLPFGDIRAAASADGETAIAWVSGRGGLRAAVGSPGSGFGPGEVLVADGPATFGLPRADVPAPSLAIDDAGNAVLVWEVVVTTPAACRICGDGTSSRGVFASMRPAGGSFSSPVQLAPPQPNPAAPVLAMNGVGPAAVAWNGDQGVVMLATSSSPGVLPGAATAVSRRGFAVAAAGMDDAGTVTLAGLGSDNVPAVVVRGADAVVQPLYRVGARFLTVGRGFVLDVASNGDAVMAWSGEPLYASLRRRGGQFGRPIRLAPATIDAPLGATIDSRGRVRVLWRSYTRPHPTLSISEGSVERGFTSRRIVSDAHRGARDRAELAGSPDGSAIIGWLQTDPQGANPAARLTTSVDGAPFDAPPTLTPAIDEATVAPAVAVDARGRSVVVWSSLVGDRQRLLARTASSNPLGATAVVADESAPPIRAGSDLRPRASPVDLQVERVSRSGRIHPQVFCVSHFGAACRGTLSIRSPKIYVGSAAFAVKAGHAKRITVQVSRRARRAARQRRSPYAITATTRRPGGRTVRDRQRIYIRTAR